MLILPLQYFSLFDEKLENEFKKTLKPSLDNKCKFEIQPQLFRFQ